MPRLPTVRPGAVGGMANDLSRELLASGTSICSSPAARRLRDDQPTIFASAAVEGDRYNAQLSQALPILVVPRTELHRHGHT